MKFTPTDSIMDVVEIAPQCRRALRREVFLPCDVISYYEDEPIGHTVTDISRFGMWIDTHLPLHKGAEVVLSFQPPGCDDAVLLVFAYVTRVVTGRRRGDRGRIGMGLEFHDLDDDARGRLGECLKGLPPRLRRRRVLN